MSLLKYIALSSALSLPLTALAAEGSATLILPGGSASLDVAAMEDLDELALWLAADPEREVVITDSSVMATSTPEERSLALDRANAIQHYLTAQGVTVDQISVRAHDTAVATISGEQQRMITIESGPPAVAAAPVVPAPVQPAPEEVQPVVGKEPSYTTEPVADEDEDEEEEGFGFVMSAGAGVNQFFSDQARDLTDPGATWDVRASFATNEYVGVEAAYVGSWNGGDGLSGQDANIYGNGVEGDLLINPLPDMMVSPYLFGGVGWTNYQVTGGGPLDTGDSDNVLAIPAGVGLAVNVGAAYLDVRGTLRSVFDAELLDPVATGDNASPNLHNWSATARLGIELD